MGKDNVETTMVNQYWLVDNGESITVHEPQGADITTETAWCVVIEDRRNELEYKVVMKLK
jgi:hypothetical protein